MNMGYLRPADTYASPRPRQRLQTHEALGALADPPTQLGEVAPGFAGTSDIIADMKKEALSAYPDERINVLARQITMGCPPHDAACEAATVLRWFQENFRYTRLPFHPKGFQRLQTPSYTLFDSPVRTGECASLSTAMAAILMSLGFEVQFETAGQDPADPLTFEHVFVSVLIPDYGWAAADPSYQLALGELHENARVTRKWPIS